MGSTDAVAQLDPGNATAASPGLAHLDGVEYGSSGDSWEEQPHQRPGKRGPLAAGHSANMAHLPGLAEIDPGLAAIGQWKPVALIKAGGAFKDVNRGKQPEGQGIELTLDLSLTRNRHRERP
jgi:hypothetical protein